MQLDVPGTALLLMDLEAGTLASLPPGDAAALVANASRLLQWARQHDIPVVFIVVAFRPGYPEIPAHNKRFSAVRGSGRLIFGAPDATIAAELTPLPHEPVVPKRRVGALSHTDALPILHAHGARKLILAGTRTSGVVLSTLCQASDLDFELTVVKDACADPDTEVHRVLMEKVFPFSADVLTTAEVVGGTLVPGR